MSPPADEEKRAGALFSARYEAALELAGLRHDGQRRRDTGAPYLIHLAHVAAILARAGFDEDTQIVGLLHDLIEDTCDGPAEEEERREEIEARFGPATLAAVLALTEPQRDAAGRHLRWRARKEAYLAQLEAAPDAAVAVAAADKLHNLSTMIGQLRGRSGEALWEMFTGAPDAQLWFYRAALDVLRRRLSHPLLEELAAQVEALEAEVRAYEA